MLHTPRAQLSAAALRRPSKLRQMVSLSLWLCSLTPSAPRMKARPLELPAMRPVSGVDRTSIRFFQTPVRMKRENTAPEKHRAKKKRVGFLNGDTHKTHKMSINVRGESASSS